jgi:hypothetical protein
MLQVLSNQEVSIISGSRRIDPLTASPYENLMHATYTIYSVTKL